MKKQELQTILMDDYLRCFGDFNPNNLICKKFCAMNLRCAIERDFCFHLELFDDTVLHNGVPMRIN